MSDYTEALADPKSWQPEPGIVIRPFHQRYPGMPELFHVYCKQHPDFGFCGEEHEACAAALLHVAIHTPSPTEQEDNRG